MAMEEDRASLLPPLRLGLVSAAFMLSIVACGTANVSNRNASNSATLTWDAVMLNTDGTALTDLAGYKVFYGPSASAMDTIVELADPSQTTYVVSNLSSGTWYFGVVAYTNIGTQSAMSTVVTKTIN
jgi:hypothetical protein